MPALSHGTVCFVSLELGELVLSLRLFFVKNFAVILVEGRECGSRALLARLRRSSCSSVPRSLPPVLCGGGAGLGLSRACLPRHITTYDLESGPWARLPRSFSYPPPPSHGMSRLGGLCMSPRFEMSSVLFPGNIGLHFCGISRSFFSNV